MAFPVILVDSASGSDSAASGAGPSTALTGSAAATDGTGLVVTLDGSPSLTGVAVDGSHAIYLADTTSGARNFSKITAKDDSAKTVTVSNAFGLSQSGKSWAIGGKRVSIGSTTSKKLAENNSVAGDAMPGWSIEMASGHSETLAATLTFRRTGDATDGPITLRGAASPATLPLLIFSNNGAMITSGASVGFLRFRDFELRNTHATKTSSIGLSLAAAVNPIAVERVRIAHATDKVFKAVSCGNGNLFESCEFANCASDAMTIVNVGVGRIVACVFRDNAGDGLDHSGPNVGWIIESNLFVRNGGAGINDSRSGGTIGGGTVRHNTFHANTGAGLAIAASTTILTALRIESNQFTGNGGYGLHFSGTPPTAVLDACAVAVTNNNFGTGATANTSGAASGITLDASNLSVDPGYADATSATNNFAVGANVKALGYPTANLGNMATGTRSYVDIGAAQRQEPSGGGLVLPRPMNGGYSS